MFWKYFEPFIDILCIGLACIGFTNKAAVEIAKEQGIDSFAEFELLFKMEAKASVSFSTIQVVLLLTQQKANPLHPTMSIQFLIEPRITLSLCYHLCLKTLSCTPYLLEILILK